MRRLAAVLDDVGPAVAAADVRSVTGLLALGVDLTDRRARAAGQSGAADALAAALPSLRRLPGMHVATLSPPAALTGAAEASARDRWLLIRRGVETRQS